MLLQFVMRLRILCWVRFWRYSNSKLHLNWLILKGNNLNNVSNLHFLNCLSIDKKGLRNVEKDRRSGREGDRSAGLQMISSILLYAETPFLLTAQVSSRLNTSLRRTAMDLLGLLWTRMWIHRCVIKGHGLWKTMAIFDWMAFINLIKAPIWVLVPLLCSVSE